MVTLEHRYSSRTCFLQFLQEVLERGEGGSADDDRLGSWFVLRASVFHSSNAISVRHWLQGHLRWLQLSCARCFREVKGWNGGAEKVVLVPGAEALGTSNLTFGFFRSYGIESFLRREGVLCPRATRVAVRGTHSKFSYQLILFDSNS